MQDYLSGLLVQTQPKQSTTALETIAKLCDRMINSTLLEDRRAAVLGLKGFCREYRETVVTGGLRGLISELQMDRLDTETVKATLETVLLLFVRDKGEGSEIDYISLWLADEFTQKEENIFLLIDLLENTDFYVRLYTLQLLGAILANRADRTKQCVFAAPLGISRFVSTLDDSREAIQNEAVMLLIHLVDGHPDIQKLVAFEGAFDKIFLIIEREAGVHGGIIVRDCLRLIANLLRINPSNQTLFRETSCIPRLSNLMIVQKGDSDWDAQRVRNMILVLEICRLFVVEDSLETPGNQEILFQAGVLMNVLRLAFADSTNIQVRAIALVAGGDLIRANHDIQEKFANIDVPYINVSVPGDSGHIQIEPEVIPVTQALLNWALGSSSIYAFDLRVGACMCLEGYLADNNFTRVAFLEDAIDAYLNDNRGQKNSKLLSGILDHETDLRSDPYRTWFACVIMLYIFEGGQELRDLARSITIGDESQGEEIVTAIQTISANLVASLQFGLDIRISVAYIMLLSVWLYEDYEAINDFLSEGSSVQSLVADVSQSSSHNVIVEDMCTVLLAVLFSYCTTQSPIPRPTLHRLLVNRIGRDSFVMKLRSLRRHPLVRDFDPTEILSANKDETGLPKVYFNRVFMDFFKDRYSRLEKALDRDPNRDPISPEAIEAQNEQAMESIESMAKEIDQLKAAFATSQSARDETASSLAAAIANAEEILREKSAFEQRFSDAQGQITKLKEQLDALGSEMSSERESRERERKSYEGAVQSTGLDNMRKDKRIKELEEQVRRTASSSSSLEKELSRRQDRITQIENREKAAKEASLAEKMRLEGRIRQIEDSRSKMQMQIQETDKQLGALQGLIDGFKNKLSEQSNEVETLRKTVSERESAVADLIKQGMDQKDRIAELEGELSQCNSDNEKLRDRISELEQQVSEKANEAAHALALKSDLEQSSQELEKAVIALAVTKEELKEKEVEIKTERERAEKFEKQCAEEKSMSDKLKSQLRDSEEKVEDLLLVMSDLEERLQKENDDDDDDEGEEGEEEEDDEEVEQEEVKQEEANKKSKINGKEADKVIEFTNSTEPTQNGKNEEIESMKGQTSSESEKGANGSGSEAGIDSDV
ncbi:p115 like vesicle tethering protein, partial [Lipomyces oligophaga]|uniref:p115 like vesicle tethering protein n=1 Tax=Lipomyces oligophaga TaxID=45792 RepID=UPI0034CD9C27